MELTSYMASKIKEFMNAFDQPCAECIDKSSPATALLRADLIEEEANEFALSYCPSTEELDAICDCLYVVIGTNLALGVPVLPYEKLVSKNVLPAKTSIYSDIKGAIQDLRSQFPCEKIQTRELAFLTKRMLDIGYTVGYDVLGAFLAVHKANMSKLWPLETTSFPEGTIAVRKPQGWLVKNSAGKVIKSPSFQPPNLIPFMPNVI